MYALNLDNENRILSACVVLPKGNYTNMPIVDTLPDGNIVDYLYIDGGYIYSPLPKIEIVEEPTEEMKRIIELEETMNILLGVK
jgi:hypothetical protein